MKQMSRIYDNGIYREMTAEEIANSADVPQSAPKVTPEERIEALEAAILELAEVVLGG
jgi:hypothetical protein